MNKIKTIKRHKLSVTSDELRIIRIAIKIYQAHEYHDKCSTTEKQMIESMRAAMDKVNCDD